MNLTEFFMLEDDFVTFSEQQASAFAKGIARDFNPIHDPGSRRFCVPGDLLFCVLLHRYGASRTTAVQFSGMLDGQTKMHLPAVGGGHMPIVDANNKLLLSLFLEGERYTNPEFVSSLSEQYVKFSGKTFPDILVPLMRDANAMINPDRPMVIYKDMAIDIDATSAELLENFSVDQQTELVVTDTSISVNGRKGAVRLQFAISVDGQSIGRGEKNMVLSGLRDFDESAMSEVVDKYNQWRSDYQG